jgi:hypothetical protein
MAIEPTALNVDSPIDGPPHVPMPVPARATPFAQADQLKSETAIAMPPPVIGPQDAGVEGAPLEGAALQSVRLGFFQQPWVQELLPFVTSLLLHATIIIVAVLTIKTIEIIKAPPTEEQIVIPDSNIVENGPPGGVQNIGLNDNPLKEAAQDKTPDGATPNGFADTKGPQVNLESAGGGSGDSTDSIISVGPGGGFGKGSSMGLSRGGSDGEGTGEGSGALARFGEPGGGGIGPQGPVFGHGGNAHTIVFVCDCTGSMINKISQLKIELSRAVQGLKPIQSFDVIFYQDEKVLKLDNSLIPATPENKRKCETWLDDIVTAGTTDPVPALTAGLNFKAQLMYFLTDAADFPDVKAVQQVFRKVNADKKTRVNTILFVENKEEQEANKESEPLMRGISSENGGQFKWVRMDQLD